MNAWVRREMADLSAEELRLEDEPNVKAMVGAIVANISQGTNQVLTVLESLNLEGTTTEELSTAVEVARRKLTGKARG
jgi:hypothetical protein